jgi:O-antigen/teichoic acid export membrane protein
MTKDIQQIRNGRWNYTEVLVNSLALFVLYKFLLINMGIAAVGIWSIVVATTSLGRIADLGTAGGMGRYVAIVRADTTKDAATRAEATLVYVETGLLFSTLIFAVIGAILYWPAFYAIKLAVPESAIGTVAQLLPISIVAFVTMNIANVGSAALTGMHRSDLKSKISIIGSFVQVVIAFALKDEYGLASLALAQVVQNLVMLVGGWLTVLYLIHEKVILTLPWRLQAAPLKDLAGFGMKLQFSAILGFISEPAIKYVLSIVGGLATVGVYELVTKSILLVRQFVIAPTPNLVPVFAALLTADRSRLAQTYREATAMLVMAGVAAMALCAFGSPVISLVWLGHIQTDFVVYSLIMAPGWAMNIICIPGFSVGIARGTLRWTILGNLLVLAIGPAFGIGFGSALDDPIFVVAASSASIGIGSLFVAYLNCRSLNLALFPAATEYRSVIRHWLNFRRS